METPIEQFRAALELNAPQFAVELLPEQLARLSEYYELLLKWNPRLHLVAPCSPDEFAFKHILESLTLLKNLPPNASVADIGTGAGLPLIPCLLVRRDLRGLLVESSPRKAVFLREALRVIKPPDRAKLAIGRFEALPTPDVEFITCRALDKFTEFLPQLVEWAPDNVTFLLFAGEAVRTQITQLLRVRAVEQMPRSTNRFLVISRPKGS